MSDEWEQLSARAGQTLDKLVVLAWARAMLRGEFMVKPGETTDQAMERECFEARQGCVDALRDMVRDRANRGCISKAVLNKAESALERLDALR